MAIKRINPIAIHEGKPYRDGEIITGEMVNEVVKVLKDGVNYNKFFIDAMFAGETEEAIVIGVPKEEENTTAEDITQLKAFIIANSIPVGEGQKAFVFRCIYGNEDDTTEITGVQALNYYKYVSNDWVLQYPVTMDTFIKGVSSDFDVYAELTDLDDSDLFIVKDVSAEVPKKITKSNMKETLGINGNTQNIADMKDGTTIVKKAEQDANGNDITTTYETKADATSNKSEIDGRLDTAESEITKIKDGTTIVKKAEQDKNGNDIVDTYETKVIVSGINSRVTSLESSKLNKDFTSFIEEVSLSLSDVFVVDKGSGARKVNLGTLASYLSTQELELFTIVEELPNENQNPNTIYLSVTENEEGQNQLLEYIWIANQERWELIGSLEVDLSNYYTKAEVNGLLEDKVDKIAGKGLSTNDYTNTDKQSVEKIPTIEQDILDLESDKVDKNNAITAGTKTKITYDEKGLVTGGSDLIESDIPNLAISKTIGLQGTLDNKLNKNDDIVGATKPKITYDSKGLVTAGADLTEADIPALPASRITQTTERMFVSDNEKSTWNGKQNALTAGEGISISDDVISAVGGITVETWNTTTKTLALSDANKLFVCSSTGNQTLTVPLNVSVPFPIGTMITFLLKSTDKVTFMGAEITSMNDLIELKTLYGMASLIKISANSWQLVGALE